MALYTPEYKPNGKEIAVITTDEGTIRVQLHGEDAPIHVGNFVELAQKGFYDGLKFHRRLGRQPVLLLPRSPALPRHRLHGLR